MTALCALVASASAPPTPFMIYGYVSYEDGSECDNPTVNINNTNTSNEWSTVIKTNASYNYYQLILANGSDVNANEILRFNVTSPTGNQSNITEHTVTQENITDGGLFNFNITLEAPAAPTITDWYNNKTLNNSTAITINESECVFFNATADQTIDVWSWFVNGTNQSHNFDNFSYCGWTVNGTYSVEVNGKNANGTSNTVNWTVTVNDTTPPEIVDHTPTGTNVPVTTNITANFSEAINPSTLNNETIVVENSTGSKIEGDITYTSETCTVTFDPVSNLEYNETYNVTITTGVQDLAGNNMSSNFTWNFTTRSEVMEATIAIGTATTSPGNTTIVPMMIYNATNVGVVKVNLTYNQSVVMVINVTGVDFDSTIPNLEHNSSGFVRIGAFQIDNPGLNGVITIANIKLKAVGTIGQSSTLNISVNEFKDATPYGVEIPYVISNGTFNIMVKDITPPASITNLQNVTGNFWINWTWTNPGDADFNHTTVYINGTFETNTSDNYYNKTNLNAHDTRTISAHTVDTAGNVNSTWVNQTTTIPNNVPVANAGMDQVVLVNESVFFDGSGSYDPDGEAISSYYWDFGDGSNGTGVTPTHNYTINGTYNVTLTVTDSNGATGNDTCNVTAYKNGDANGDGEVMLFDAMYLAKSVLGITGYEAIPITSDVNGDGEVTLFDAMYLAKHVLEITGFEDLK